MENNVFQFIDFVRPVASRTGSQGSERSSANVLSAIPDLLRGTRYLSTCRQLLTLTLSSVYLKLTYLLLLINYLIAFIVHVCDVCWTIVCVSGHIILLYVCMYVFQYSVQIFLIAHAYRFKDKNIYIWTECSAASDAPLRGVLQIKVVAFKRKLKTYLFSAADFQ